MRPMFGTFAKTPEYLGSLKQMERGILAKLRGPVPTQATIFPVLDVVLDEGPGVYYVRCQQDYYRMEQYLQLVEEPKPMSLTKMSVALQEFSAVLQVFGELIMCLKHQRRAHHLSTRRDRYVAPANGGAIDKVTDAVAGGGPEGHLRRYTLWVNDVVVKVQNPNVWRERRVIYRGPVPEFVRQVVQTPRSDASNTRSSLSTMTVPDSASDSGTDDEAAPRDAASLNNRLYPAPRRGSLPVAPVGQEDEVPPLLTVDEADGMIESPTLIV